MRREAGWTKGPGGPSMHQREFADFMGVRQGLVLDEGCGPGKFHSDFDESVDYVGVDPLVLPDAQDFAFAQALAEYLPFQDGIFTDVVVLDALDHFRDVDGFLADARRVLRPGGRLHLLQSVHEITGPLSLVKVIGHKLKDALEDKRLATQGFNAPKHLSEFTHRSLVQVFGMHFDLVADSSYSARWYRPVKLFMTFEARL
jgi:ubiquinone/menaquinone biosynthesis C-methylase UbiE